MEPNRKSDWTQASPAELASALRAVLLLDSAPVGVRLMDSHEEFEQCSFPAPPTPVYYCSAVRMATEGAALKLALEDISCDTSPRTLGLEPGFHDPEFEASYVTGGLYKDIAVAHAVLSDVETPSAMVGIAVAPLDGFSDEEPPDVVIVAISPYAAMRIAQACNFSGKAVRSSTIGMHGICAESTAAPFCTGEVCTSFLCSGTRHVAGWDDNLMSAGIPFARLPELVEALLVTTQRFETDERKSEMRTSCRCVLPCSEKTADELEQLSAGAGYFYEE